MKEVDVVEGLTRRHTREKIVKAIRKMKPGKPGGLSEVNIEILTASGETGIKVMMELCQQVLNERGMPINWEMSVMVPVFKGKGNVMNCRAYTGLNRA